jgi:hypothetical protein
LFGVVLMIFLTYILTVESLNNQKRRRKKKSRRRRRRKKNPNPKEIF